MSQPCDRCDINTVTMHCLDCNQMFCTDCGNELHSEGESQNHRLNTLTLTKLEHKTESPSSTDSLDILAESLNSIRAFPPVEIAVESESSSTQTSPQPIPVNSEQPAEKVVASWDRKASLRGPRSHQTTYVGRARSTLFDNSELNQLRNEISVKDEENTSNGADNSKSEDKPVESTTSKSALTAIIESEQQNSNSSTPNEDSPPLTSEPNVQKSPTTSTDSLPTPTTPTPTNTNTSSNNTISSSNSNSNSSPMTAMTSPITSPSQPMKIQPKNASPLSKQNPNLGSSMPNLYMSKSPPVRPVRTGLTSSSESPNKSPIRPHTNVSRTKMDSMPEIGQLSVSVADLRNKLGASIPLNFKPPPNSTIASIAKERPPQNTSETPQEKAPTQPQEKGLPRFAEFTIVENSKNITLKKQFPRVCTVGQVVAWCVKQMENSNEKSHYGLFHKDLLLDSERFLFTFEQLNNKDTLELKVIPDGTDFMIKVTVAELNNVSITLKVDELSSVWTVTQKVIKKLITRNFNWLASIQYGLFCGSDPIEMNENDLIITYKDKIEQVRVAPKIMGVIFKRREGVQESLDLKTTVFCNDAVPFTFDSNEKIDRCVRKFIKHYVLKTQGIVTNAYEYTLAYYPNDMEDTMILIDPNETLSQCGIKEGDSLEFHRRVRDYIVELPGNTITSLTISFDSLTTVQECLSFVSYNFPEIFSGVSQSEWQICVKRDGSLLDPLRTLWSYELENSIVIKRKQYPINIMLGQTQKTITIDYSVPVSTIMPQLWTAFSIFPKKSHEFSMKVLGPDSPIDQSRSLNQQSVSHNSTINIKLIGEPTSGENENKTNIDVNIWEKEVLDPCVLFESDTNKLRAGTLNKLVEFLTSATDTDLYYMQAFLMTFNSFTTPGKLMEKLIQRYHVPVPEFADPSELDQWKKTFQRTIQLRVCNVLRYWLENHWQDFDHDLIQFVVNFVDNLQTDQKNLVGKQINKAVLQRTCGMKTREKAVINTKNFPAIIDKPLKKKDKPITLFDCDELEIARQLTLIDFDYYEKILPIELLNQNWTKKPEKSPYVIDFIQRSSAVSFWVTSLILEPNRVSIRALRYAFLVRVAEHLRNLNNFSGMMAFLGGFNSASISRLKFTKNSLPRKCVETIAELESIMNPSGSFKNYRDALHNSNPPCIPYIGTYLSDLTFIDDGNPNTVQGLINFAKHQLTFGVISELQRYQLVKYQLHSFPQRHSLLKDFPVIDDKALYEISLLREPRNAEKVL